MVDFVATVIVLVFGTLLLVLRLRAFTDEERPYLVASFVMHLLGAAAQLYMGFVVYRGVVDWLGFRRSGQVIARAITSDPVGVLPQTVLLFLHQEGSIGIPIPDGGRSTVSMWVLASYGEVLFAGSFVATFVAFAIFAFFGKTALYQAFRESFKPALRPWLALSTMLVPSLVFWTSGLVKEGVALAGLGFAVLGVRRLLDREPRALVSLVPGLVFLGVSKAWVLVPLMVACVSWFYLQRATSGGRSLDVRPVSLVAAAAAMVALVFGIGEMFPAFKLSTLGEQAARMQGYGQAGLGGSAYILGDSGERSLLGQLRFAPIALLTALYRPLLIEARNPQMLLNGIETTGFFVLTMLVLWRRGWRWVAGVVLRSPTLGFCFALWLPAALGAGLVSNNLGTLSRYRTPMVPFFVLFLLVLYATSIGRAGATEQPEDVGPEPEPEPVPARDSLARGRRPVRRTASRGRR